MLSKPLKDVARTISFRLNLWYASIFIATAAVLFVLSYLLLSIAVERKEREVLEAQLKEYAAIYQSSGLNALQNWVVRSSAATRQKSFFVRLARPFDADVLLSVPEDWIAFDRRRLQIGPWQIQRGFIRIPQNEEKDFALVA